MAPVAQEIGSEGSLCGAGQLEQSSWCMSGTQGRPEGACPPHLSSRRARAGRPEDGWTSPAGLRTDLGLCPRGPREPGSVGKGKRGGSQLLSSSPSLACMWANILERWGLFSPAPGLGASGGRPLPGVLLSLRCPGLRWPPSPAHLLCVNVRAESSREHLRRLTRQSRWVISLMNRIRTHK